MRKIAPDAVPVCSSPGDFAHPTGLKPLALAKWLIFLGRACFRLLFSRFFRFSADISKAVMRFCLLFTTICKCDAVNCTQEFRANHHRRRHPAFGRYEEDVPATGQAVCASPAQGRQACSANLSTFREKCAAGLVVLARS